MGKKIAVAQILKAREQMGDSKFARTVSFAELQNLRNRGVRESGNAVKAENRRYKVLCKMQLDKTPNLCCQVTSSNILEEH